jgi:hypothetical protein
MRQAAQERKGTLIWFSGSGWNAASDAAEPALLDPAFGSEVASSFACVRADFPAAKQTDRPVDPQYTMWAERLGITQLPSLVALDAEGLPYAQLPAPAADGAVYRGIVADLRQRKANRDDAFAQAKLVAGVARARLLDRALQSVGSFAAAWYPAVLAEVVALDPSDEAGLKSKYEPLIAQATIDRVIQQEIYPMLDAVRFADVIVRLDKLMEEARPSVEQRQLLIAFKAQVAYSKGDNAQAMAWIDQAIALRPASAVAERIAHARGQIVEGTSGTK